MVVMVVLLVVRVAMMVFCCDFVEGQSGDGEEREGKMHDGEGLKGFCSIKEISKKII